jgi:putative hydrolase of the HAD superfamily
VLPQLALPVEAVVFDLGGVLIEIDFARAFTHWAQHAGVATEALRERFRLDDFYERHERGEIDADGYFAWLRKSLGIAIADDAIEAGWGAIFVGEVPGIRAVLRSLPEAVPRYVFSNTNECHERIWRKDFADLLAPFDRVFTSCELGIRKPAPEAYHAVARAIDVAPEHILFFDDTPANVAGALAVGMQAVHVGSLGDIENAIRNTHWFNNKEKTR